ncbi:MAG: radical SAM protein [Bacteroidetes bacterium]|nr:MAG: radical SAM protein [Bacteroidota bacterium]
MSKAAAFRPSGNWIRSLRGPKNKVEAWRPSHFMREKEHSLNGRVEDVNVIFLSNQECPFSCLMCDLWKNTLDEAVPKGAIPAQIAYALDRLPPAPHLKLYNSSSFFDPGAIPEDDYAAIAELVKGYESLIVENHPRFTDKRCLRFASMIEPSLELGMGLECVHPDILPALNKQLSLDSFQKSVARLRQHGIRSRAYILLRPPFLSEKEGVEWACKSIDFAFACGVDTCSLIPTRAGNGAMDLLQQRGDFHPPALASLEAVLEYGIGLGKGTVFADTWDLEFIASCAHCFAARRDRIEQINLKQEILPEVRCCCNRT